MASGKKNYFRHSVNARKDPKIMALIINHGKEAFFHYWALVEMCAEIAIDEGFPENETFTFHRRTICNELMVTPQRLSGHLLAIKSSLLGDLVVTGERVEIKFPKLMKYLGRYETKLSSNSPNKRKEKERKEKESKLISEDEKNEAFASPQKLSPISFLFSNNPEIQSWLNEGVHETHLMLLKKHSHHVLVDLIEKAYAWAKPRGARAETWLYTWVSNKNTNGLGLNRAKAVKTTATPSNPTGNPYLEELRQKYGNQAEEA